MIMGALEIEWLCSVSLIHSRLVVGGVFFLGRRYHTLNVLETSSGNLETEPGGLETELAVLGAHGTQEFRC